MSSSSSSSTKDNKIIGIVMLFFISHMEGQGSYNQESMKRLSDFSFGRKKKQAGVGCRPCNLREQDCLR